MRKIVMTFVAVASVVFSGCAQIVAENVPQIPDISEVSVEEVPEVHEPVVTVIDGNEVITLSYDEVNDYIGDVNDGRQMWNFPHLVFENGKPAASEYVPGNIVNIRDLRKYLIKHKGEDVSVNLGDFLYAPASERVVKVEEEIKAEAEPYAEFQISYENGEVIDISDFTEFLRVRNNRILTCFEGEEFEAKVEEVVKEKTVNFNTYEGGFAFNSTSKGEMVVVNDPAAYCQSTCGAKVNIEKEIEHVKEALANLESEENRVPILSKEGAFEIGNTYVEVSKDDQHLWFYKDGQLVMESNVVTGNKGTMDTPSGVYNIFYMSRGINFGGGLSSARWAKFTARGHGLHDATWRPDSDFESAETYEGNGSHGCVNLPLEFAKELYEELEIGTIVVVY